MVRDLEAAEAALAKLYAAHDIPASSPSVWHIAHDSVVIADGVARASASASKYLHSDPA